MISALLAVTLPLFIANYLVWWIAGAIIVLGLLVFGFDDLKRLSLKRIWAISSVCFAESIRRRVLWVTPLAILGALAVGQLQHSLDLQEIIRQTIKYCLFTSGVLVTITAVILACTNLPKEIENRVIFTIVTKPTTRLEIVLGKTLGFVRVSGLIILIMGVFTLVYLELRANRLNAEIASRLKVEQDESTRQALLGYQTAGLLSTRSVEQPVKVQVLERIPTEGSAAWLAGGRSYFYVVPFDVDAIRPQLSTAMVDPSRAQIVAVTTLRLRRNAPSKQDLQWIRERRLPMEEQLLGPGINQEAKPIPQLTVRVVDQDLNPLFQKNPINDDKPISIDPAHVNPDGTYTVPVPLPPAVLARLGDLQRFQIEVDPETPSVDYEIDSMPTVLVAATSEAQQMIKPASDAGGNGPATPQFLTKAGRYGFRVEGNKDGTGGIAAYHFNGIRTSAGPDDKVDFRFRAGIERGGDYDAAQAWSIVTLEVVNRKTHESSGQIEFHPETNREALVAVPARYVSGGDFDAYIRGRDNGQWLGVTKNSLAFISSEHSFAINLVKSLFILWLLSGLVVIIAIFTSTFLSWPIAIILTMVILLGHWGVEQLGDALSPGVGRSVATDLGFRDAAQLKVVSSSVDALARLLNTVSVVLPDVGRFPVMEDITRGVSIPGKSIADSLSVLLCYGLPMLVLSFVILKNKEVAP